MRVNYPLKDISTDAEAKNYFGHRNLFGKYPIGAHNAWHGGVHLEGANEEIQCIANGRIIAYRFAKDYKKTKINNTDHLYSNGFILIQHDYKSKEKQKMTFYSLYHHLMPETDINSTKNSADIPNIFSKKVTKVKQLKQTIKGLNARSKEKYSIKKFVLPKGAIVTIDNEDTLDTHWSKATKAKFKKISYTDLHGNIHNNIYIATIKKYVTDIGNNQLQVNNTNNDEGKRVEEGENLRETGSYTGKILTILKSDTKVIVEKTEGNYSKVKYTKDDGTEQTGYIYSASLENKKSIDDSIKLDEIVACDIPIKAGATIGYTGNFDFKGFKGYKASHLEVFTTDDVCEFLSNEKKDGKEEQYFSNIEAGTKLKTSLSYKVDVKANTPIKVLNIEGDYAKVEIKPVVRTLIRDTHINDIKNGKYTIIDFEVVNKIFDGLLKKGTTFKGGEKGDIAPETTWKANKNRIATYKTPENGKIFWIEKTSIAKTTEKVKKEQNLFTSVISEYLLTEEQKYDTVTREAKVGEKTTLYGDVCKAYIEVPFRTDVEEVTVKKEKLVDLRKFKKVKDDKKDLWYKVVLDYTTSSQCVTAEGWIKEKDLTKFSAYNWKKFGFKALDAGNEYIYSVKDLCDATDSAAFVTEVWDKTIDEDGNKILDIGELSRAFNKPEIVQKLSRLVCKHKNEWSYTMAEIKPEVKELYDFGIQLEEEAAEKQKLETERDDSLAKMETKIKDLMWWEEAKKNDKNYKPPIKEEDKTKTSSTKRPSMLPDDEKEEATTSKTVVDAKQTDVVPLNGTKAPKNEGTTNNNSLIFPVGLNATTIKDTNQEPVPVTTAAKPDSNPAGGEPVETKKEEKEKPPKRMFPITNIVHHFHPIAWVEQMRRVFGGSSNCQCEAKIRAFMRMLREGEGTSGESGYTRIFGGGDFTKPPHNKDLTTHPQIKIFWYKNKKGENVYSSATGAYQLMGYSWNGLNGNIYNKKTKKTNYIESKDYIKKYAISDFSPKSQDELCIVLLKHKRTGLLDKLLDGFVTFTIETYGSYEWASLSPGRYKNQGSHSKKTIQKARVKQLEYYDKYLAEEISGSTDLHLEEGFLKKFNIKCNCENQKELIENKKKGLDLNKAIIGLNRRAGASDTSVGLCAKYVRLALEDGGMLTWGKNKNDQRPGSAKDYGPFLLHKGFVEIPDGDYQTGDIAVIESFPKNEHGHIEMFNGKNWVSDFIQRTFYPGRAYRKTKPNYKIYRWK